MLLIKNLYLNYQVQKQTVSALSDINLQINPGSIVGLSGPSGAGKSSLLRCCNGLIKPSSGEISLDEVKLDFAHPERLRKQRSKIGMIFQQFCLLSRRTVYENIALPLELKGEKPGPNHQQINSLLDWVGMQKHAQHYPAQLSGGQKQRVAIARAIIQKPKYLLCDEPTSALDQKASSKILDLLKQINQEQKITIIIVSHSQEVLETLCQTIVKLKDGKIQTIDTVERVAS